MKKIIVAFLSLIGVHTLSALPIGSPVEPAILAEGVFFSGSGDCYPYHAGCFQNWSVCIGYYGDFVFNRNLHIRSGEGLDQGRVIKKTWLNTHAAYFALNVCRVAEVFGTLGATRLRFQTPETSWFLEGTHEGTMYMKSSFSWSLGGRAVLFNCRGFSLGVEGQYFRTQPRYSVYSSMGFIFQHTYFNDAPKTAFSEWQVGGALSYTLHTACPDLAVVPYIGFKGSRVHFDTLNFTFVDAVFGDTLTIFNMSNHKTYGFAVGTTFDFGEQIAITVEGRFADERAFYVNGQICF